MDNAGNLVNFVSGIIRLPSVGIPRSASRTNDRFCLFETLTLKSPPPPPLQKKKKKKKADKVYVCKI